LCVKKKNTQDVVLPRGVEQALFPGAPDLTGRTGRAVEDELSSQDDIPARTEFQGL